MTKKMAWYEQPMRGPFPAWTCGCCRNESTFAEYAGKDGSAICGECAVMACYLLPTCAIK